MQFIILNGLTSREYFIFVTCLIYMYYSSCSWTMSSERNQISFMLRWELSKYTVVFFTCTAVFVASVALTKVLKMYMYLTWIDCNRLSSLGGRDFKDTANFNMMRLILYWSSLLTNNNTPGIWYSSHALVETDLMQP